MKNTPFYSILLIISLLSIVFTSCRMSRYCYGFDLQDHKDITFRNNDTITYFSDNLGTKDSLVLSVSDFFYTEPYEHSEISIIPDYECCPEAYYQTCEVANISIREHLSECNDMAVQIGNDNYSFSLGYRNSVLTDTIGTNYSITYSFVMVDQEKFFCWTLNDLTGTRRFDSFTKMEYRGIIEFHDKKTGIIWKQN